MPNKSSFSKNELLFFSYLQNLIVKLPHMFTDTKNLSRASAKSTGCKNELQLSVQMCPLYSSSLSRGKQQANDRKQRRKTNRWLLGSQSHF